MSIIMAVDKQMKPRKAARGIHMANAGGLPGVIYEERKGSAFQKRTLVRRFGLTRGGCTAGVLRAWTGSGVVCERHVIEKLHGERESRDVSEQMARPSPLSYASVSEAQIPYGSRSHSLDGP
ncbi:hypothetical protein AOLI_G00092920 [Acnodon oligacanthus]